MKYLRYAPPIALAFAAGICAALAKVTSQDIDLLMLSAMVFISVALIMEIREKPAPAKAPALWPYMLLTSLLLTGGLALGVDKLFLLAAAILLTAACLMICPPDQRRRFIVFAMFITIIPLPAAIEAFITRQLSPLEAGLAAGFLSLSGSHVEQVGAQILIGEHIIAVNRDCSSINLLAPAMLGTLLSVGMRGSNYMGVGFWALGSLLFMIALNSMRVLILAYAAPLADEAVFSSLHDGLGIVAMVLAWLMPVIILAPRNTIIKAPRKLSRYITYMAFLVAGHQATYAAQPTDDITEHTQHRSLPTYYGGWVGTPRLITDDERRILKAAKIDRRQYRTQYTNQTVTVTLMQFASQKLAEAHDSIRCFEAQGWQVRVVQDTRMADGTRYMTLITHGINKRQRVYEFFIDMQGISTRLQIVSPFVAPAHLGYWIRDLAKHLEEAG